MESQKKMTADRLNRVLRSMSKKAPVLKNIRVWENPHSGRFETTLHLYTEAYLSPSEIEHTANRGKLRILLKAKVSNALWEMKSLLEKSIEELVYEEAE